MPFDLNFLAARRAFAAAPRAWAAPAVILIASVCAGCGSSKVAPDLDEGLAQSSLAAALDAWKQDQTPESLRQGSSSIIVVEPQWQAGQKLVNYQVLEPITNDGSNLHVPVELELEDADGASSKQTVTYTVGTSPRITIFSEEPTE